MLHRLSLLWGTMKKHTKSQHLLCICPWVYFYKWSLNDSYVQLFPKDCQNCLHLCWISVSCVTLRFSSSFVSTLASFLDFLMCIYCVMAEYIFYKNNSKVQKLYFFKSVSGVIKSSSDFLFFKSTSDFLFFAFLLYFYHMASCKKQ